MSILFLKLHPLPLQHTPSYENSVIFAGVSLGCLLGLRFSHQSVNFFGPPEARLLTSGAGLLRLSRRVVLGQPPPLPPTPPHHTRRPLSSLAT